MKTEKKHYIFPLIMVLLLILFSVLFLYQMKAAPSSKNPEDDQPPMEISIGIWDVADALKGDELLSIVESKFNIKLVPVNVTYMNWTDKFLKMAASDTLPDIICHDIIGTSTYNTWVKQGLVKRIPMDLSKYPNLKSYMDSEYMDYFKDEEGTMFSIPRVTYDSEEMWALDRCIIIRKDWLENLGLSMPQNFQEFETMLSRFITDDPDGNGVDDTSGLCIANMNMYEAIYLSIFPELSNIERGWMKENGKWMPVYCSSRTGDALSYAKRLYEKQLLDYDFAYQNSIDARYAFSQGKCGAIASQFLELANIWSNSNPDVEFTDVAAVMEPWPTQDNTTYRFTTSLHWSETYISKNVSDEKLERILSLYDYLISQEFHDLLEAHPAKANPSSEILGILVSWNQQDQYEGRGRNIGQFSRKTLDYANDEIDWFRKNTERVDFNWNIIFLNSEYKNQLPSYKEVQNEMIKVIIGEEDAPVAWEKSLNRLKEKTTLNQAIDEVTAIAEKNGW